MLYIPLNLKDFHAYYVSLKSLFVNIFLMESYSCDNLNLNYLPYIVFLFKTTNTKLNYMLLMLML